MRQGLMCPLSSGHRSRCPDCAQHENLRQIDGGCSQEGPGPDSDSRLRLFGWLRLASASAWGIPRAQIDLTCSINRNTHKHTHTIYIYILLFIIIWLKKPKVPTLATNYSICSYPRPSHHTLQWKITLFAVGCLRTLISFRIPVVFKFWHFFWISNSPPKKIHPDKEVLDARNGCCSCGHHGLQSAHHCSGQCTWPAGGRGSVQGATQGHENSVLRRMNYYLRLIDTNWFCCNGGSINVSLNNALYSNETSL